MKEGKMLTAKSTGGQIPHVLWPPTHSLAIARVHEGHAEARSQLQEQTRCPQRMPPGAAPGTDSVEKPQEIPP